MEDQDKINKRNAEEPQELAKEKSQTQDNETTPKRAEIKATKKTILDFQDDTNLNEDEDQITQQGGSLGAVPPGFRSDNQDSYV